jgi:hypothetical protein
MRACFPIYIYIDGRRPAVVWASEAPRTENWAPGRGAEGCGLLGCGLRPRRQLLAAAAAAAATGLRAATAVQLLWCGG